MRFCPFERKLCVVTGCGLYNPVSHDLNNVLIAQINEN